MEYKFKEVMSKRTDEELFEIVTIQKGDYNPQAIKAAEQEIEIRNIDVDKFSEIKESITVEKRKTEQVDTNIVSSGIRFLNFLIDFIVWLIIAAILTFPLNAKDETQMLLGYLILFITFVGYYAIMEIKFQKTIGKFATKTKVVKLDGDKPKNGDIIARTFYRLIPLDRISFLFTKNGFHDFLSKTTVVKDTNE